ncbi:hypothetical protein SELMODRAFT_405782 [Selaginella moellendorffii]|uniref:PCI domain-containing protein n=2 Tax=Selaginella moellendorffii TaxID=88036 RepID=D8QZP4_SELML|nr:SAC3 family protein B isoform X1 [Selaginella moellendorffii]EFJ34837.1 hypothetical protein SELMODRAFT_405782 [Selaginella moellendorffii]|eukprot:XP_002964504.1 SAC3 family protein B isoform X1 [Selaginella moellendorffii]
MEENATPIAAYTNFGADTAGPLTPPTLPFGFGKAAFRAPAPAAATAVVASSPFSPDPPSNRRGEALSPEVFSLDLPARRGAPLPPHGSTIQKPPVPRPSSSSFSGPSEPIPGLCPDMCPESERSERERIGDLDRYERVGGDRNQTSISLAVKKYTRTPDKDPMLIRSLPVLRATMDYLLGLLEQSYTQELLGLYNFLWDRMRAVRVDLRMQHIFNHEAIVMHEQMIRLHILAMHELCEFPKGEGFVEGFDAHLNIEQMNKAFSELFQMYDDHRRKGEPLMTEPEFRGYYALLKLDQHPGFAVEPFDLSVHLSSMSPAMRNSSDVIFARKVARMYKLPNYIGFFKLAAKATYLQACLMHAQFSKVRSQALAALYSGLRVSQGIPLSQLKKWLGMERHEVGDLLSYHGFSIKLFEEPYVVKESEFLNKDQDYGLHRSRLVESKRSPRIIDDVVSQNREAPRFTAQSPELQTDMTEYVSFNAVQEAPAEIVEEEMPDYDDGETPVFIAKAPTVVETPVAPSYIFPTGSFDWLRPLNLSQPAEKHIDVGAPLPSMQDSMVAEKTSTGKRTRSDDYEEQDHSPKRQEITSPGEVSLAEAEELERKEEEARLEEARQEEERMKFEEASTGRARLWFRRWKRKTDAIMEAARLRKLRARAALSSMILGLPMQHGRKYVSRLTKQGLAKEDLDRLKTQRVSLLNSMWKFLDVSEIVSPVLRAKNPRAGTIYWKLVFCMGDNSSKGRGSELPAHWLRSKLIGNLEGDTVTCYISSNVENKVACHCITKEIGLDRSFQPGINGASALLFLVDEGSPLSRMRSKLHSLVESLPTGTSVPLLVFSSGFGSDEGDLNRRPPPEEELALLLQLHRLDGDKISSWIVLSITGKSEHGFYSSETLARGIEWLATLAPAQPELHAVDLRDLVAEKLYSTLNSSREETKAEPGDYVAVFNKALHDATAEVTNAASTSPSYWPPPDLATLSEAWYKDQDTPPAGWNSFGSLQPIFYALELCRLPPFPHLDERTPFALALSRLSAEAILDCVRAQYKSLLAPLEVYLSKLGYEEPEANRVAASILDGAVSLEWSEGGCRILANWRRVFRSIFWTKLMRLNSEPPPTVYLLREMSFHRDEVGDYEKSLAFASRLQGGDIPEAIQEKVVSFVERYNQQYTKETETARDTATSKPEDVMLRHELEYLRSGDELELLSLLPKARDEEEAVLPQTEPEARLDELVARLDKRLDENTQAAATGLEEIPRPWTEDTKLLVLTPEGTGLEVLEVTSPRSSSSDSYKRFNELLSSCHSAQTLVSGKLTSYFGVF